MLVFLTLWPAYILIGIGTVENASVVTHIGGAFGIATAVIAWYVSFADTLHNTVGKRILPLVPFGGREVDTAPAEARAYRPATNPQ
jgi:succinate-acetate transporter protein